MPVERAKPEELVEAVGRRVAELRSQRGWTQEEAAEHLRISLRHMKRIERGLNMTLHSLARIAAVFGVTPAAVVTPPRAWPKRRPGRPRKPA